MLIQNVQAGQSLVFRLPYGEDLLQSLTDICRDKGIQAGKVEVIGAVQSAAVAYYDQENQEYHRLELPGEWEILSCLGNISLKDGQAMVHAHILLADSQGKAFGGHLVQGCSIFAGEGFIQEFLGASLNRGLDATTGLTLWQE
ncbi:MAG: PPC domain-containing DNA-binding protein [Desulfohalobiaceae bacterium]